MHIIWWWCYRWWWLWWGYVCKHINIGKRIINDDDLVDQQAFFNDLSKLTGNSDDISLSIYVFIYLSITCMYVISIISIHTSFHLSISIYMPTYTYINLFIHLSIYSFIYLSYLSIYLFIHINLPIIHWSIN